MAIDTVGTDRLVTCPCCGEPVRFARTVSKIADLPEMQTFECRLCRLAVTAEQVLGITEARGGKAATPLLPVVKE